MRVAQFTGWSGSGKTTLIVGLIRLYAARGLRVGAVKHTHHPANDRLDGDTAKFLEAGAERVLLAGEATAVLFASGVGETVSYESPSDLLRWFESMDVILIEGFKSFRGWPRIELDASTRQSADVVARFLDRIEDPPT